MKLERNTAAAARRVSRSGQVVASAVARSSGSPTLDAETLALVRRAEPLPPPPPEMPAIPLP